MEYWEYQELKSSNAIRMGVDDSTALVLIQQLPKRYYYAHSFWTWIWILSIPGAFVIGWLYSWWLTPLILFFVTPAIFNSTKKSCAQFVLEHAEENEDFYNYLNSKDLIKFIDPEGNPL